jgi:hypothetical protein
MGVTDLPDVILSIATMGCVFAMHRWLDIIMNIYIHEKRIGYLIMARD